MTQHFFSVKVSQLCLTLMTLWTVAHQDSLSVGILQTRVLEWLTIPYSGESSQPRDQTLVSYIAGEFFTV